MKYATTPRLIDQLADLTAIRDQELLEFSLLKTLHGFMRPGQLLILKLDLRGRPVKEVVYGERSCSVLHEEIQVPPLMLHAIDVLNASGIGQHSVLVEGKTLTVGMLLETRTHRTYLLFTTDHELSKLDRHLLAGMLQIYRNFCALLKHSQTDQLTGLANRHTFDQAMAKVFEISPTPSDPIENERRRASGEWDYWIAMIDIDHFKSINDRFGHLYGDEVLVILAQLMKSHFRDDDMVFRFGGEEFALLCRCPDLETARQVLDRFRLAVAERIFPQVGQVTVSIGATRITREIFVMTLVDYADQALYESKRSGRNRISFFEEMVTEGKAKFEEVESGDIDFF